jgi:hypothetical protein
MEELDEMIDTLLFVAPRPKCVKPGTISGVFTNQLLELQAS